MKQPVRLNGRDLEHLVVTIETSLAVSTRAQFYLWVQGALQGFIPHETLFCGHGDIVKMQLQHETFTRVPHDPKIEQAVRDPVNGLLPRIVDDWLRHLRAPRLFSADGEGQAGRRQLFGDLKRFDFGHAVAQGAKDVQGAFGSFFLFVRVPHTPGARDAYLLEVLMPYLHMALHRMLASESGDKPAPASAVTLLSKREIQVLHWVKNGKTNQEIALILDLSPPTVKNHLQNIMRKLNVNNRAQAVGKSVSLRLVAPGDAITIQTD
jgi:transcriptional regulator EpsA